MILDFADQKKLVIKLGSSLLVSEGKLRKKWLQSLADNVAELTKQEFQITIVSSGAIAVGRSILKLGNRKLALEEKQAAAAVGQIQLMSVYRDFFKKHNLHVAQILLTAADCNSRTRYLNSKNTIDALLKNQIIPVINENDSVAVDEIKIVDNDRLAARVAQMIDADAMILFSDIDGLYNQNPKTNKDAQLISKISTITKEIESMAGGSVSEVGTGGMITKIMAAKMLSHTKCKTFITNGIKNNSLRDFIEGKQKFTLFLSDETTSNSREKWLSGFLNTKGSAIVNACAVEALRGKKVSLLPIGVVGIKGEFHKGDAIFIRDENGQHIASGLSNFDSSDVKKILGKQSSEVRKILGKSVKTELVHIDNLVVI